MTIEELRDYVEEERSQNNIPYHVYSALIDGIDTLEQEPCEDAISRQAVIDTFGLSEKTRKYGGDHSGYGTMMLYEIQQTLEDLPPVTPKQRTGHWIAQDIHNCHTDFKCSECGYIHSFMHLYGKPTADYTYCPNCGAWMVEPQESEDKDGGV